MAQLRWTARGINKGVRHKSVEIEDGKAFGRRGQDV